MEIDIQTPDGATFKVTIPDGLMEGQHFQVQIPAPAAPSAAVIAAKQCNAVQRLENPSARVGSKWYARAEVAAAMHRQKGTQKRLQQMSPSLAVLHGTNWLFNPDPPLDPALVTKLGRHFPPELPYTAAIWKVLDAYIDVHVGWEKRGVGGQAQRDNRWALQEQAIQDTLEELNVLLEAKKVQFVAESGPVQTTLQDLKIKVRSGKGGRVRSQQSTKHSVTKETTIYLVFEEEEQEPVVAGEVVGMAAAGPAVKIKELKDLLDAGAITQEEFDAAKARLLEALVTS